MIFYFFLLLLLLLLLFILLLLVMVLDDDFVSRYNSAGLFLSSRQFIIELYEIGV